MPKDTSAESRTTQSQKQQQIWAYPKNVNLLVHGQGNVSLNWLQLFSYERKRKIERKIFESNSFGLLLHVLQTQWLSKPPWHKPASQDENSYAFFPLSDTL